MSTYSQYSYYQQPSVVQQNNAFSTQQGGMTWNGSQWVSSSASESAAPFPGSYGQVVPNSTGAAGGGGYSRYSAAPQAPPQQQQNSPPPAPPAPPGHPSEPAPTGNEDPSVLVTRYSLYYQTWKRQADENRVKEKGLPPGPERDEASRLAQWADYYSNQASASAHHYNGLVRQRQQQQGAPPPQPPSPQQQQSNQNQLPSTPSQPKRKSRWSDRASSPPETSPTTSTSQDRGSSAPPKLSGPPATPGGQPGGPPPESLKRYIHRCLSRCATDVERSAMQAEAERKISESIRAGTMHSTDWDRLELLPLPSADGSGDSARPVSSSSSSSGSPPSNKRAKREGNLSFSCSMERNFNRYDENLPANDSYYGSTGSGRGDDGFQGKFGKQNFFQNLAGKGVNTRNDSRNDSPYNKRKSDDRWYGRTFEQDLPANDSYYGSYGPSRDGASSVCSDDRSRVSNRGRGDEGSLASEHDFISLSSRGRKQSKKKQQKKPNQKSQQQRQAAYQRTNSSASTGSVNDGFERSSKTLAARASRFAGRGGISDAVDASSRSDTGISVDRYMGKGVISGMKKVLDETDYERMTVKGTCTVLEKDYLRLTSPPRAELVRPRKILEKHLMNLKKLWGKAEKDRGGNGKRDYQWFCSQFKAMRQDLTVQRIFDPFTVEVYETHARIALEKGDLNEYNQCQTQLKELYEQLARGQGADAAFTGDGAVKKEENQGDGKKEKKARTGLENQHEFIAYRIIYYVYLTGNKKYEGGSSDLFKIMLSLTPEQREDSVIAHALKVRVAVAEFDYHAFFSLQDAAPKMAAYLMDYLVPQVRHTALQRIHKAYRPSVPVKHVLKELGFDSNDPQDAKEGRTWLKSCGCKLSADGETFLTKDSLLKESDLADKKSSLI